MDKDPKQKGAAAAYHEPEGMAMDCTESEDEVEQSSAANTPIQQHHNQAHPSAASVPNHDLNAASISPDFVQNSVASSSGQDRFETDILRSMHPLRQEIVGASDNACIETGHSSIQGIHPRQPTTSPWIANAGNFLEQKKPLKVDLLLPPVQISLENNILRLEESDYIPVSIGWGFSLLGLFAGRFPGKDAIINLTKRWKAPARVSYHPKGWLIFRFETEEQAAAVLKGGPYSVFGIQLALSHLPPDFRFDSNPELQFKVWATLPNLPLELWNASAISKIASVVGTPIEVDSYTLSKHSVAGPRVLILVDAKKEPLDSITLQLHNGTSFSQSIILDYYPFFCTRCKRAGHLASACRAPDHTNTGTRPPPRNHFQSNAEKGGWQVVKHGKYRAGRSRSRLPTNRSLSRVPSKAPTRSKSRPPKQQWQPKNQDQPAAANLQNDDTHPNKTANTHIYFHSPSPDQNDIELSNKFQPIDDLEQYEEAATMHQLPHISPQPEPSTIPKNQPSQQTVYVEENRFPAAPTAPAAARYIPPPVRHETTVHQRVNSSDTLSTECIPIGKNDAAPVNNNGDKEQLMAATPAPAAHGKQGNTPSYVNILTSPPNNDPNAGAEHNLNKLRMEAKVLDPRNAYKKKLQALVPPSTAAAGRVLTRKIATKRK